MKNEIMKTELVPAETVTDPRELHEWIGRREAFALLAGRCAAADIESLRRIREQKLYKQYREKWADFCTLDLHVARRSVDREIAYLQEFGPEFFHVRQMAHITPLQYRAIAAHVNVEGVHLNGTTVPLLPENSRQVAEAVGQLLNQIESKEPKRSPAKFDSALKRCQTVTEMLEDLEEPLDPSQRMELAHAIAHLRTAAAVLGVVVMDRR